MIVSLAYIIAENVGCILLLFLAHPNSDVQHMDVLKPILILCIAAGTDSSFIFFNIYYHRFERDSVNLLNHSYLDGSLLAEQREVNFWRHLEIIGKYVASILLLHLIQAK